MPDYNRVMLMGNLTRDIDLRYTQSKTPIAAFGMAINRKWKSQDGQMNEEVTFVDCEAWGKSAEVLNQYMSKGKPLMVEGRLKLDQFQDRDGNNRQKLKVVVERFVFIGGKGDGQSRQQTDDNPF